MTSSDLPADGLRGHMAAMDETDRQIVEALRADGRMSMRALADLIHISRASAYARVARLEREGVITGYAAQVDPVRYGYALSAYVYVDIAQRSWKSVRGQLLSMPAVDHVALLSGEHDIVIRVRARDAVSLRDTVLTRLQEIPEVRSTQTVLIFEEATPGQQPGKGLATPGSVRENSNSLSLTEAGSCWEPTDSLGSTPLSWLRGGSPE
jgi:DNA-binding Lrp family transcriptional regulator